MRRIRSVASLSCIILVLFLHPVNAISIEVPADLQQGPFVDKVVFTVINAYESKINALQSGTIDLDTGYIKLSELPAFTTNPYTDVFESPRNGYVHITINCARYPFSISGFRRAFAYAFNKTKVVNDIFSGHASLHDSVVPSVNRWCAEDFFDYHYYDAEPEIGNKILDELGFAVDNTTGFREAPNGDPISITVIYHTNSIFVKHDRNIGFLDEIAGAAVEALHSLNLDAKQERIDFYFEPWWHPPINNDYDMVIYESDFQYDDIDWLVTEYGSQYIGDDFHNPSDFSNDTYDSWISQLRYGKTYEEIYEASVEMQKILHYNVPRLVICQDSLVQGYRIDQLEGHIGDLQRQISGLWTLRKIRPVDNSFGGTVVVSMDQEPDSFNIFTTYSPYSNMILENLYSSLYLQDPNMNPIPDLAESMLVETHSNNPDVPSNHTRFTFDIIQNATWSDSEPLTAEDVAFTFTYIDRSGDYGNPAAAELEGFVAADAPTLYTAVIEFDSESYWNFDRIAYTSIIPEHIFNGPLGIGFNHWNIWNPVFNPEDPHVTSGPFIFTNLSAGDFYELTQNPNYYWHPDVPPTPSPTTSTPTPTTSISRFPIELLLSLVMMASTATIVIVVGLVIDKYRRK